MITEAVDQLRSTSWRGAGSLRKRQLIASFGSLRTGTFWGIRSDMSDDGLADSLPCPAGKTLILVNTKTRLKRLDAVTSGTPDQRGLCDV